MQKLEKMPTKSAVIDDSTFFMTYKFMAEHSAPTTGSGKFDMYNGIADTFWNILMFAKNKLPDDVIIYFIMHEETNDFGEVKLKSIGKLLNKMGVEAQVTVALRCSIKDGKHVFITQSDGSDITKSPEGMFPTKEIDNDLKAVDTAIREYWGLGDGK